MKQCLNCGNSLKGPFCEQCGQKSSTHRLSMKHFVQHDLVHGLWHVDKGLLHTMWQLLRRPGSFLNQYLEGKRVGAFNVVTMLLIGTGLLLFISNFQGQIGEVEASLEKAEGTQQVINIFKFLEHNAKWLILALIPIFSLASFIVFQRRNYFYTEHLVINSYIFGMFLFLMLLFSLLFRLPFLAGAQDADLAFFISVLYLVYAYWQTWRPCYGVAGLLLRFLGVFLLAFLFTLMLGFIAVWLTAKFSEK